MRKLITATTFAIIAGFGLSALPAGADVLQGPFPDVLVKKAGAAEFKGDGITAPYGAGQSVRYKIPAGRWTSTTWRMQNDGDVADNFFAWGFASTPEFRVKYFSRDGVDITASVTGGRSLPLSPGQRVDVEVRVKPTKRAAVGIRRSVLLEMFTFDETVSDIAIIEVGRK